MYYPCFIYSIPKEVSTRRNFGFLVIPGLNEMANMERLHPEPISPDPEIASQHHRLIIRYEGSIGCPTIKAK
jgi:hypothetical protein